MHIPVSDWATTPDECYDTVQWPVILGDKDDETAPRYWYDCRFLKFEQKDFLFRLTVLMPEIA